MQQPYILTISSEKGGVGKTTLATNLAIYLKALNEELPVTLFSFDNHFSVDRMFRIGRGTPRGDVQDLLAGRPAVDLVETGEYGVQYIASSRQLPALRERLQNPEVLAGILAGSGLQGIIIIDTRPDLDVFTRNALYAADRVIVPVKDTPSLENCKNLFDFFQEAGLSRKTLRILPCLIDSRIRYDGPFKDPYQLLKAYAINRGYRCLEGYISKSPKVESLNTNPQGKIYPVLTHGRGTDVHLQFTHLARQVYLGFMESRERRLAAVAAAALSHQQARTDLFAARRAQLQPGCLLCGRTLVGPEGLAAAGYYCETSDGRISGFLEEECFSEVIFRSIYQSRKEIGAQDPLRDLFRESAQRSYFVLRRAPNTHNFFQQQLAFYRFDDEGLEISCKIIDLKEFEARFLLKERSNLFQLVSRTLLDRQNRLGDWFLLVRKVGSDFPDELLYDENHRNFCAVRDRIAGQLH